MTRHLALLVVLLAWVAPAGAAKVTCPNGRYLLTGATVITTTAGVPPVVEIADGAASIIGGCPLLKGRAKPTRKGVRVSGRWQDCGGYKKLKLKALIPAACDTISGTIRGRGLSPTFVTGTVSTCGDGSVDTASGEECDVGAACQDLSPCDALCHCGGPSGTTTTTIQTGSGATVAFLDAFCTKDACNCGPSPGFDYHLKANGTAGGPVGTELRINVGASQGGAIDCGSWSPIDGSVNASCNTIKCCRREAGQPETTSWAALEAIDLPCICPSAPGPLEHNYVAQAQAPGTTFPAEEFRTTSPCP